MRVNSITCYCENTSPSDFLSEDKYASVISKLDTIKSELENNGSQLDSLMASGQGFSASSLNFGGFSPLFEMSYLLKSNMNTAIDSIDEVASSIKSDAKKHLTDEWTRYYQEIFDLSKLNNSLSELKSPDDDEKINSINKKIKEHEKELASAKTSLITAAGGADAASLALSDAFETSSIKPQTPSTSATVMDSGKIQEYINNNSAGGSWASYAKNLKTGEIMDINGNDSKTSASVIKLFIMGAAYDAMDQDPNLKSQLEPNIGPMITVSDNEATNRIIDTLGMDRINSYIQANGYTGTSLNRKMLAERTTENYTSAKDTADFLEKVYNNEINHSEEMLGYLKNQQRTNKIPSGVPSGVVVANKTGELDDVENDAAIVYSGGGDYVLVVLSDDLDNTGQAQGTIQGISSMVYEDFNEDEEQ